MMNLIMKQVKCIVLQLALPVLVLCAGLPHHYGNRHHFIESPKLSKWGEWGKLEHCPSDQVVVGMRLKVQDLQGIKDDTGLNGVKFYCQNPYSSAEYAEDIVAITSLVGSYGEWKETFFCPAAAAGSSKLIAVGFQLRSETSTGVKDDTAGNNLKLVCSDLYQKQGYTYLEGDGTPRGDWTERQLCWPGYAVCGLQTQVETSPSIDKTGLNNMKVRCCKVESGYTIASVPNSNASHISISHDSRGSSSSSENSGESSASGEKDGGNHNDTEDPHRGDHATSREYSGEDTVGGARSGESQELPDEQELVAIVDPEPTEEQESETANESSAVPANGASTETEKSQPSSSSIENEQAISNEDENLPEEIAQIDQVDNSEAHHDEEENISTATDSLKHAIPEDVVNALEDADSADSPSDQTDHQHPHSFNDKPFHWGTEVTNLTDLNDHIISDHEEGLNSLDKEPKSSPRFGQIGENSNVTIPYVSNHASQVSNNWRSLGIGSMITFYLVKLLL